MNFSLRFLSILLLGLWSCAYPQEIEFSSDNCPFSATRYGGRVQCGFLEVDEGEAENSRKVRIAMAHIASRSGEENVPIVYLAGGPGGDALSSVGLWVNHPFTEEHDMVLIDQRGTGASEALCPGLGRSFIDIMAKDLTLDQEFEELQTLAGPCKSSLTEKGVNLENYNSTTNARDIDEIRQKLGYEQWHLFGGSYGTRLALTVMRNHPEGVRSAILAGPYPPNIHMYTSLIPNFRLSLNRVFEACQSDPQCQSQYPELEDRFYSAIAALREKPITFKTRSKEDFTINTQDALLIAHQLLYQRNGIGSFPRFVAGLESGNAAVLERSIVPLAARASAIDIGMFLSVQAFDELPFNDQKDHLQTVEDNPEFAPGLSFFSNDIRLQETWHKARADRDYEEPVISNIPALVVTGEFDPITPPENGEITLQSLKNANHIMFPGDGHSFFTPCHGKVMTAFFDDPETAPNGDCIRSLPKIRFQ